ncbi:MAG: MFS transporter [Chloroflexota bacterium]
MQKSTFMGLERWQITLAVVFFSQLLTAVGFSLVFPFLPLYVDNLSSTTGLSVEWMAGLVIAVQGFTMMIASPLWGAVADRYGRKLMVMRATFGGTIVMGMMGLVTSGEQLIFLRGVQGLVTGTVAANNALVASAAPRDKVGFAMGTLQVGLWGGVALGPLLGGVLADAFGFAMPFFITAGALFLSGVMIYFGVDEDFEPQVADESQDRPSMISQWQHVLMANGVNVVYLMRFLSGVGRAMIIPIAPLFVVSLLNPEVAEQSIYAGLVMSVSSATATASGVYLGR